MLVKSVLMQNKFTHKFLICSTEFPLSKYKTLETKQFQKRLMQNTDSALFVTVLSAVA
jgi:hypothetical protein